MIIETLQDQQSTQEEKNEVLNPYQEYLKAQSQLIEEDKEREFYVEGDDPSLGAARAGGDCRNTKQPKPAAQDGARGG